MSEKKLYCWRVMQESPKIEAWGEATEQDLRELGWVKADLKSVCSWFIEKYPDDIFTGESGDVRAVCVSKIVKECKKVLKG